MKKFVFFPVILMLMSCLCPENPIGSVTDCDTLTPYNNGVASVDSFLDSMIYNNTIIYGTPINFDSLLRAVLIPDSANLSLK
jgi:hypothetical protein